jgi:hypothetical protein
VLKPSARATADAASDIGAADSAALLVDAGSATSPPHLAVDDCSAAGDAADDVIAAAVSTADDSAATTGLAAVRDTDTVGTRVTDSEETASTTTTLGTAATGLSG